MRNTILIFSALTLLSMDTGKSKVKNESIRDHIKDAATVSLKYSGKIVGFTNFSVDIHVEMDTSIGIRYEIMYGGNITSHTALFYKFSNPHKAILYNFLTHKSTVVSDGGSANEPDVSVIGKDMINNYTCTHLRHESSNETQDYWMSPSVAGFAEVCRVLNSVNPNLKLMVINQSIFNWGGLVRLKMESETSRGQTTIFNLDLVSAQAGIPIRLEDFDVPSK